MPNQESERRFLRFSWARSNERFKIVIDYFAGLRAFCLRPGDPSPWVLPRSPAQMNQAAFSTIWNSTLGQTLEIQASESALTNGLSNETSQRYEDAAALSDDEIWDKLQAGLL
jgi:hypothetical protein